jgi:hypothetical protein
LLAKKVTNKHEWAKKKGSSFVMLSLLENSATGAKVSCQLTNNSQPRFERNCNLTSNPYHPLKKPIAVSLSPNLKRRVNKGVLFEPKKVILIWVSKFPLQLPVRPPPLSW